MPALQSRRSESKSSPSRETSTSLIVRPAVMFAVCVALVPASASAQPAWQTTARCSVAGANTANNDVYTTALSGDGRHVVFVSRATNLGGSPQRDTLQVFAFDRQTSQLVLVSFSAGYSTPTVAGSADSVAPSISTNGRFVALQSDAFLQYGGYSGRSNIYVFDRDFDNNGTLDEPAMSSRKVVTVSVGSDGRAFPGSYRPSISSDGRFVAFHANAVEYGIGGPIPGDTLATPFFATRANVFVRDRDADGNGIFDETTPGARKTVQVNMDSAGQPAAPGTNSTNASISGDGRFVAFESSAANLVDDDTNNLTDIFLHDRDADANGTFDEPGGIATARVNVSSNGRQANGPTSRPALSADGRYIAFDSLATNLVPGVTHGVQQVYVHDRIARETRLVSARDGRFPAASHCYVPAISADGRFLAFHTAADLIASDTNAAFDVYVWDRLAADARPVAAPILTRASVSSTGAQLGPGGIQPAIDASGRVVSFVSVAKNVVGPPDYYGMRHAYVAVRQD